MVRMNGHRSYVLAGVVVLALGGTSLTVMAGDAGKAAEPAKSGDATGTAKADAAKTGGTAKSGETAGAAKTGSAAKPGDAAGAAKAGESQSPQLAKAVAKVQQTYAKFQSLQADFTQTSRLSPASKPRVDTGTVELKKGGRMRWDFEKPDVRHFISDGKTLWIYSPKDKQVIESSLAGTASKTALNFMAGLGDLNQDFSPSLATGAEYQRPGMFALDLVPKESIGGLKKLTILASEADGTVREAFIQDPMGSTTHVVFSQLKLNAPIADSRFSFKAPEGVEVVRPQGF